MSTTAQYLTHTYAATVSVQVPRTITADTDPQTVEYALHAFYRRAHDEMQHSGGVFPFATLQTVADAMLDSGAVTCLYEHDGETTARTLFPSSIALTKDRRITVGAFCTYRREHRSFRLDRMTGVHLVVMPGEVAA